MEKFIQIQSVIKCNLDSFIEEEIIKPFNKNLLKTLIPFISILIYLSTIIYILYSNLTNITQSPLFTSLNKTIPLYNLNFILLFIFTIVFVVLNMQYTKIRKDHVSYYILNYMQALCVNPIMLFIMLSILSLVTEINPFKETLFGLIIIVIPSIFLSLFINFTIPRHKLIPIFLGTKIFDKNQNNDIQYDVIATEVIIRSQKELEAMTISDIKTTSKISCKRIETITSQLQLFSLLITIIGTVSVTSVISNNTSIDKTFTILSVCLFLIISILYIIRLYYIIHIMEIIYIICEMELENRTKNNFQENNEEQFTIKKIKFNPLVMMIKLLINKILNKP